MASSIDWLYHRKNCVTCQRARDYLEAHEISVKTETNAAKERQGPEQALTLARAAAKIHAARGKKIVHFDMKKSPPDDAAILAHLLGPTGNLRAPTVRKGKELYIGFSEEIYQELK